MKSRYCYCPMTAKRIGRRAGLLYRFRRWKAERRKWRDRPDVFRVTGFNPPIYPGK